LSINKQKSQLCGTATGQATTGQTASRAKRSDTPKNNFWLKLAKKAKKAQN
jgi:hypothetical protein